MQTLSRTGAGYRTQLLPRAKAERFARLIGANPRFTGAAVVESTRAKDATCRHFVSYAPASEERAAALLQVHQDAREQRAQEQAAGYELIVTGEPHQPFATVIKLETGAFYETTVHSCTCPDFRFRLEGTGVRCKHMAMLSARLEAGADRLPMVEEPTAAVPSAPTGMDPDRYARAIADRALWG